MSGGQNYLLLYSQWTWPKWVVPYRLWRFSHKFEHPKSTLYYFSFPLILSDTHMGHPFRQRHSGISFEMHLQMCFRHKPSSTWHRDSVAGKPRQATAIGGEAVHWDVRPDTRQFGHNPQHPMYRKLRFATFGWSVGDCCWQMIFRIMDDLCCPNHSFFVGILWFDLKQGSLAGTFTVASSILSLTIYWENYFPCCG